MAEVFHKETWARVRAGDVVLLPWSSLVEVVEAAVVAVKAATSPLDGRELVLADLDAVGERFREWPFDRETVAYVRSRF